MSDDIRVEFDVPAPMRDGAILRANIFRPAEAGTYPVILARTPYAKDFGSVSPFIDSVRMARAGYIVVLQDTRGRFRSDGEWTPTRHEGPDGYDSVEWAARLPGSNGKVGMLGPSYVGFTQWAAALQKPPSLRAIVPSITWADPRDGVFWRGGAFELGLFANWWLGALGLDILVRRTATASMPEKVAALVGLVREIDRLRPEGYASLPLRDFEPLRRLDLATEELADQLAHAHDPAFHAHATLVGRYADLTVPALNVGGWYDIFTQGTLTNFQGMRAEGGSDAARRSRLVMGPWSHVNYGNVVGDVDFGFASSLAFMNLQTDLNGLTQRWFDYWLKGLDNGVTDEPPVQLFIMGDNVWRTEQEWPLARTQYTPYYLHGEGRLSPQPPASDETPDTYVYDPADPTPTVGGALLMPALYGPGARDQRPVEARPDVLVYTSDTLTQDTEVTGPLVVKLWAASDAPDTDFVARLVDVHPDGFAQNLADGVVRARYRDGDTPALLEPGRVYEYTIHLWATANVFKAGHRIRLDIASANFPRWDRNPNTGAPFGQDSELRPARQTVLHDAGHPTHVVLPIIPR